MGRYEVTEREYHAYRPDRTIRNSDRHPVTLVTWDDVRGYLSWLSSMTGLTYRLPTDAEWDRAAAGSQPGCVDRTVIEEGCPVGSSGNLNSAGLYDMAGNVWGLTEDCWDGDCTRRVVRGGSWLDAPGLDPAATASRFGILIDLRTVEAGFRVARTLD